ncbi:MAG: tyrosine-type recombinase/integrase [Planctomycetes bacterium]|nr:tyrosine-type recombinase/integrase [Planctomycetota bacterium]
MRFEKYFNAFKEHLEERNLAERTVETYCYNTKRFFHFLEKYYPRIKSLEKVTKDIALDYQKYLRSYKNRKGDPLSSKTRILRLIIIRKFFSFLVKQDLILKNPASSITLPKEEQRLTRNILTQKEMLGLLENMKLTDPVSIRNRAIIELFYGCGIRTTEICQLKIQDVDLKEQTATIVKGKGNKFRIVPMGQYATHYIQLYLEKARKYMLKGKRNDHGYLFLSQRGNPFNNTTINKSVMRSVAKKLENKKYLSCYSMRHSIATHLLANNMDITYIAKLLGHSSLRTTQRYLRVEIGDLKKMHSLYHPRERDS